MARVSPPHPPREQSPSKGAQWDSAYHAPVLASRVVALLGGAGHVLDCTLGGGGHTLALLESGVSRVDALDRDPQAVAAARDRLRTQEAQGRFDAHLGNYAEIDQIPQLVGERFGGILLDLGVSSHQVDDPSRGFTFREGAPLDMRMGGGGGGVADPGDSAADLLNSREELVLAEIFRTYGDERRAFRLAREIVRRRQTRPFATSDDLVGAIRGALGPRTGPADFARLFQAVRIAVNDELDGLERALPRLRDRLAPGGTLAVIAYHSGEDRIVKNALREWSTDCVCPPKQIVCTCRGQALGELLTRKSITADAEEIARNPRSRSARLRAFRIWPESV